MALFSFLSSFAFSPAPHPVIRSFRHYPESFLRPLYVPFLAPRLPSRALFEMEWRRGVNILIDRRCASHRSSVLEPSQARLPPSSIEAAALLASHRYTTPSFLQSRRTPIHPFIPFRLLANLVSASSRHHRIITHRHTLPAFDLPSYVSSLVRYSTRVPCMTIINQSNNPRDRPSIARCVLLAVVAPSLGGARTDGVDGMDGCWVLARFVDWRIE